MLGDAFYHKPKMIDVSIVAWKMESENIMIGFEAFC